MFWGVVPGVVSCLMRCPFIMMVQLPANAEPPSYAVLVPHGLAIQLIIGALCLTRSGHPIVWPRVDLMRMHGSAAWRNFPRTRTNPVRALVAFSFKCVMACFPCPRSALGGMDEFLTSRRVFLRRPDLIWTSGPGRAFPSLGAKGFHN